MDELSADLLDTSSDLSDFMSPFYTENEEEFEEARLQVEN